MLDVRGNCSIASFVYDTALCVAWVHAGPAQILCRFKTQYIVCKVVRPSEARGRAGPLSGCRGSHTRLHAALAAPRVFHQEAMWPSCVARVHAGPRRSGRGSII